MEAALRMRKGFTFWKNEETPMGQCYDQIMDAIISAPGSSLEEIFCACPNLTWNQIFHEVDRLSREGHVLLRLKGRRRYSVMSAATVSCEA